MADVLVPEPILTGKALTNHEGRWCEGNAPVSDRERGK
jgi:hypothetical protein